MKAKIQIRIGIKVMLTPKTEEPCFSRNQSIFFKMLLGTGNAKTRDNLVTLSAHRDNAEMLKLKVNTVRSTFSQKSRLLYHTAQPKRV
jgi:hypothetical protein